MPYALPHSLLAAVLIAVVGAAGSGCEPESSSAEEELACPSEEPKFAAGERCDQPEGLLCEYGYECGDGGCGSAYDCTCSNGAWSCVYTDVGYPHDNIDDEVE